MNVQGLTKTIVTTTLFVTTPKDRTSVTVLAGIMVMVETALVNIYFLHLFGELYITRHSICEKFHKRKKESFSYLNYSKTIQFDLQLDLFN